MHSRERTCTAGGRGNVHSRRRHVRGRQERLLCDLGGGWVWGCSARSFLAPPSAFRAQLPCAAIRACRSAMCGGAAHVRRSAQRGAGCGLPHARWRARGAVRTCTRVRACVRACDTCGARLRDACMHARMRRLCGWCGGAVWSYRGDSGRTYTPMARPRKVGKVHSTRTARQVKRE